MSLIKPFNGIRPKKNLAKQVTSPNISYIDNYKPNKKLNFLNLLNVTDINKSKKISVFTREDFSTMAEIAEEEGVIEESESDIIKNMVKFKDVKIRNIMTPFSVMKIASESETIQNFYNKNPKLSFSRIPIYNEKIDNITGYVLKDNILEQIVKNNGDSLLKSIKRKAIFSNYESQIPQVFDKLIKEREHISIVTDHNGTVNGIVTLEDIIETLLGREIMDETDTVKDMQALAKSKKTGVEE